MKDKIGVARDMSKTLCALLSNWKGSGLEPSTGLPTTWIVWS